VHRISGNDSLAQASKVGKAKQRTSLSEFLSLSDHKKRTEERRSRPGGYEQIDDDEDEEEPASDGTDSEKSAIAVDQIAGKLDDSRLEDPNAALT